MSEKREATGSPVSKAYYDFRAHQWVPQCPHGDVCTGCDAAGRCSRMEYEDAWLDHQESLEDARSY